MLEKTVEEHKKQIEQLDRFWNDKYRQLSEQGGQDQQRMTQQYLTIIAENERKFQNLFKNQEQSYLSQLEAQEQHFEMQINQLSNQLRVGEWRKGILTYAIGYCLGLIERFRLESEGIALPWVDEIRAGLFVDKWVAKQQGRVVCIHKGETD
ncbi:unnamed protein product (macronuclear) [Paramecium tetraurelia]|uniref:Uncharacterized protein n=1 Tax=Paramecium tetraurelia TaxID=5888 RepID=A0BTE1_PARTE|nr:uncharacterized protein GSPATT00032040001 [Paramecium tetraurelia]CAK61808.1 unnamed protein product [Paramecium tetraurelia]|eukprot:XP_001429206.1 hypothetical protein (macronuclear) [Paramecium tetraurelia strain d4-2]